MEEIGKTNNQQVKQINYQPGSLRKAKSDEASSTFLFKQTFLLLRAFVFGLMLKFNKKDHPSRLHPHSVHVIKILNKMVGFAI